ncbi:VWA domain-containing protein [Nocardioides sp.]|uniref:VWA domain-containing protein n=1 Tax=Nocardioides sp. TaxID=35761 RepID=UPI0039E61A09
MTFGQPLLLVVGLAVTAALVAGTVNVARRRRAALAAAGIAAGRGRQPGGWLTLAGIVVLAVAGAGPTASISVPQQSGTLILAVDVSGSMAADDVAPSRLAAAQQAALDIIAAQPSSVDIGVVAFEQGALTTSLPSADHTTAEAAIDRLQVSGGTSLGQAILTALSAITGDPVGIGEDGSLPDIGYWGSATIVLLSDGGHENEPDGAAVQAATLAQNAGVHIDTVGVGTPGGTTVEVDGYRLHTALDEETLTAVAETTGGSYLSASDAGQLADVSDAVDLRLTVEDQDVPLAGGFIAAALVLLGLGAVLTVLRNGRLV